MSAAALDEAPLPEPRDARPTLLHRAEYLAARGLLALLRPLGVERASALGGAVLGAVGPLVRPVSRRGEDNLRMIHPDWSEREIRRVIRGVWSNLGRTVAEFAHFDAFDLGGPEARIEIVGREHIETVRASGRPMIFVSGHFANWEAMLIALRLLEVPYAFVYRAANNPLVDALVIRLRAAAMTRHQAPKGPKGARALVETLRAGRSLALLVDQKLTDGAPTPLLGRMAPTGQTPARLALKFRVPIVYASLERLPRARFRLVVHPPIEPAPTDDADADARRLTARLNALIGADIRARPAQWLWLHRRWGKTLPAPPAPQDAEDAA